LYNSETLTYTIPVRYASEPEGKKGIIIIMAKELKLRIQIMLGRYASFSDPLWIEASITELESLI
jgi:hypothetical protein